MHPNQSLPGQLTSPPEAVRRHVFNGGAFITAYRPSTEFVEGEICSRDHLVMVTLRGGAKRHEIWTDSGHVYDGPDRPGSFSFLPANCRRKLRLHQVEWRWATLSIAGKRDSDEGGAMLSRVPAISGQDDSFVLGLLSECDRLESVDGGLDPLWRDTMLNAIVAYIARRYGSFRCEADTSGAIPAWKLRRLNDFIKANLSSELRISALASIAGLSEGHFHRAFRSETGRTPLEHVTALRMEHARQLLAKTDHSVCEVGLMVGLPNVGNFTRVFQRATGKTPGHSGGNFGSIEYLAPDRLWISGKTPRKSAETRMFRTVSEAPRIRVYHCCLPTRIP